MNIRKVLPLTVLAAFLAAPVHAQEAPFPVPPPSSTQQLKTHKIDKKKLRMMRPNRKLRNNLRKVEPEKKRLKNPLSARQ